MINFKKLHLHVIIKHYFILFYFVDPRIMKVLLGLLGYSCKIHRKKSKSSLTRFSFSETDEHRFERSFSDEEKPVEHHTDNTHSTVHAAKSNSGAHSKKKTEEENDLPSSDQAEKQKELVDHTEGITY